MELKILNTYQLSALEVIHYDNGMVELFGKDGLNVSAEQIQEMFDLFARLEPRPRIALTNRKNKYSFSFEAIQVIQNYRGIDALAILVYSRMSLIAASFARSKYFKIKVFLDRDEAIKWLNLQIN